MGLSLAAQEFHIKGTVTLTYLVVRDSPAHSAARDYYFVLQVGNFSRQSTSPLLTFLVPKDPITKIKDHFQFHFEILKNMLLEVSRFMVML